MSVIFSEGPMSILTGETNYRSLIDSTDLGLAWIDKHFRVVLHNSRMARLSGKPTTDISEERCFELYRGRKTVCFQCPGRQAMQARKTVLQAPDMDSCSGVLSSLCTYAFPALDAGGDVTGFLLVLENKGSPVWDDSEVDDNQVAFRKLVDAFPCMIWLSNSNNQWCHFNNNWLQFTGCDLAQQVADCWMKNVHPDDVQQRLTTGNEAFQNKATFSTVLRLRCRDGSYRRLLENSAPRFNEDGSFAGYIGICVDITDHSLCEQDLMGWDQRLSECAPDSGNTENQLFRQVHRAKKEWEGTIDCLKEVVVLVDDEGRVRRCNKALVKLTGKGYPDLVGKELREIFSEDSFADDVLQGHQKEVCHELGGRWFLANSYRLDDRREGSGAVLTLYDYTSLKLLTSQLVESNKNLEIKSRQLEEAYATLKTTQMKIVTQEKMATIGQLAAGVAHEINNPIGYISSNLRTLQKYLSRLTEFIRLQDAALQHPGDSNALDAVVKARKQLKPDFIVEDVVDLINESLDGSERVRKIVQDLKGFSRVDESEWRTIDLVECFESTINIVWNEIKYKANLVRDFAELPPVRCYPHQLNQVFMNLLINATQAIDKEGQITLKAWQEGDGVMFSVADTGCGIPQENISKIFEPFFTTKEIGVGTGLGLSLSYQIVKKHHGEIFVESESGKGTTFTVHLPLDAEAVSAVPDASQPNPGRI